MKKFQLTTMCAACNWKIASILQDKGFADFHIDHVNSILTFTADVNPVIIKSVVNSIGYQIEEIPDAVDYSDEELLLLQDELRLFLAFFIFRLNSFN